VVPNLIPLNSHTELQAQGVESMNLRQISPSVWAVTDGSTAGNVGCIRLEDRVVVVDTTISPPIAASFRRLVEKQVGTPITDVILTHIHSDHVFGAQVFADCRIISSMKMAALYPQLLKDQWSKEALKQQIQQLVKTSPERARQLEELTITPPTHTFDRSMTLGPHDEILIEHTGGHTVGHSTVSFYPERVLFASDLIFCQEYPFAGDPTSDPRQWMSALEKMLNMPIDRIVPGHGPTCDKEEVRRHLTYFQELETWLLAKARAKVDVQTVVKQADTSPTPPYQENMDRVSFGEGRLKGTIRRWYDFYQG